MSQTQTQRNYNYVKRKECANPLFEQWLTEWREEAVQKNSKMQYVFAKAMASLRKYPLPLKSGRECLLLEYFGPSIAKMIDKRMIEEGICIDDSQGLADLAGSSQSSQEDQYAKPKKRPKKATSTKANSETNTADEEDDDNNNASPKKKRATKKQYIPGFRSGAYALLVAIGLRELKQGYRGYMTKSELLSDAQGHCDTSMTRSEAGANYTAWNSMATLTKKELVLKQGHPSKYLLSPEGRELASKLLKADYASSLRLPTVAEEIDEDANSSQASSNGEGLNSSANFYRTRFEPGQYEVVLYVDTSETTAKCKKDEVIGELRKNGVDLEVVRLSVGDFVWVCREVVLTGPTSRRLTVSRCAELVLPFVVERKRSDDLSHSIKDGRFHEQKFRLGKTGIQPIYLHENYGRGDFGLADGALQQALANTQMTDGFWIQETNNIKDTCAYLTHMTRHLKRMYEGKRISSCTKQEWPSYKERGTDSDIYLMTFSDFNDFGTKSKNWTVTEMFARHLMRLRGLSVERAYAIVQRYPTITHLFRAYESCSSEKEKETLLQSIHFGTSGRTIGPTISKVLYRLYSSNILI